MPSSSRGSSGASSSGSSDGSSGNAGHSRQFEAVITVNDGTGSRDVLVRLPTSADDPATGADLYQLISRAAGREPPLLTVERTGELLARNASLVNAGIVSGDRLTAAPPRPNGKLRSDAGPSIDGQEGQGQASDGAEHIVLKALTGPRPGAELRFRPGDTVGRSSSGALDDPSVSRSQFRFNTSDGTVTVEDRGAVNPTVVNGRTAIPRVPVEVAPGDVIEAGSISLTLVSGPPVRRDIHHRAFTYNEGSLGFLQAPRVLDPRPEALSDPPDAPAKPPDRRFPLAAALLPVLLGAVMAVLLGPVYALFVLVSPLMVVWTYLDDRRSGRQAYARQLATYEQNLAVHRLALADHTDQLAAWHRRRTPSLTQIARWVRVGAPELWSRRPGQDDFLTVAVGQTDRSPTGPVGSQAGDASSSNPGGGAAELKADARNLVGDGPEVERSAPVSVDFGETPIVGVTGESRSAAGVASSIVGQLVGLRSPRDLRLFVLAPEHGSSWDWVRWLPHVEPPTGHGPGAFDVGEDQTRQIAVAGDDNEAKALFGQLEHLLAERRGESDRQLRARAALPHIVVVIQPPVELSPAAVSALLAEAGRFGFTVIYLAVDRVQLPAEVNVHIEAGDMRGGLEVTTLATSEVERGVRPWFLDSVSVDGLARDLAPLVDLNVGASGSTVPNSVSFQQIVGSSLPATTAVVDPPPVNTITPDGLVARWAAHRIGLLSPVGATADGPIVVDLKADGPHGLVAGTTGSGKSEFLQSMLAGIAFNHSPADVNFILVDYKGGAAFRQCRLLPHTVGFVTDLDDRLAERALVSLRAELRRREEVLAAAGVSDLDQMVETYRHGPDDGSIPASLLVVIDEFAALKNEVPDFVDGLVDVAQRGRSMGVHMILATQKPAGVITPQIDANTNIRVALRVSNEHESSDIIGQSDAASIDSSTPGRAYLKIGGGSQPVRFQSTYVGGPVNNESASEPAMFEVGYRSVARRVRLQSRNATDEQTEGPAVRSRPRSSITELEALVALAGAAWAKLGGDVGPKSDDGSLDLGSPNGPVSANGYVRLHRPWLAPLPPVLALPDLLFHGPTPDAWRHDDGPSGGQPSVPGIAVGLLDLPGQQAQVPLQLDLSSAGHVAVYGTSGSGKTTLLRAIACSLTASAADAGQVGPEVVVVDATGSLTDVAELPLVSDVVPASDTERVGLLVDRLRSLASGDRQEEAGQAVVVLIDGFAALWSTLQSMQFGRAADDFARLLGDLPGAGVHLVMTADQRSAIPHNCVSAVGVRLVQRMTSADDYRSLDIRVPPSVAGMPPGRTLVVGLGQAVVEAQIAVPIVSRVGGEGVVKTSEQVDAVRLLAADSTRMLKAAGVPARRPVLLGLPEKVTVAELVSGKAGEFPAWPNVTLGLGRGSEPLVLNFADNATLLVVGPPQSGRTVTLETLLAQTCGGEVEQRVVAPRRSSALSRRPEAVTEGFGSVMQTWADELPHRVEQAVAGLHLKPVLIVVDDAEALFDDTTVAGPLTDLVLNGRDGAVNVVCSAASFRTAQAYETWVRALRSAGHGLVLQPDGDRDEDLFDCRFPRGVSTVFPTGRGYLVERSSVRLVQVAVPDPPVPDRANPDSAARLSG